MTAGGDDASVAVSPRIVAFPEEGAKRLGPAPSVHPTASIEDGRPSARTEVGARARLVETTLGDHSDVVHDGDIISQQLRTVLV